jgi:beta-phosphoglucomutase
MIFLIDLDGTLIDSDHLHYEAWSKVLDMKPQHIEDIIKTVGMEKYLENSDFEKLKQNKYEEILNTRNIEMIKNADSFIDFIKEYDINHAVVTHTDRVIVDHFKMQVPELNALDNWIVREDYVKPKPDPECYRLALDMYAPSEKNIIGFENSKHGMQALRHVTKNTFRISKKTDYSRVIKILKNRIV